MCLEPTGLAPLSSSHAVLPLAPDGRATVPVLRTRTLLLVHKLRSVPSSGPWAPAETRTQDRSLDGAKRAVGGLGRAAAVFRSWSPRSALVPDLAYHNHGQVTGCQGCGGPGLPCRVSLDPAGTRLSHFWSSSESLALKETSPEVQQTNPQAPGPEGWRWGALCSTLASCSGNARNSNNHLTLLTLQMGKLRPRERKGC